MEIRISGIGTITIESLEARLLAYMNAGAPEPVLEGTAQEQRMIFNYLAENGDSQMKALVDRYLMVLNSDSD